MELNHEKIFAYGIVVNGENEKPHSIDKKIEEVLKMFEEKLKELTEAEIDLIINSVTTLFSDSFVSFSYVETVN